jgi:hypothetical protein
MKRLDHDEKDSLMVSCNLIVESEKQAIYDFDSAAVARTSCPELVKRVPSVGALRRWNSWSEHEEQVDTTSKQVFSSFQKDELSRLSSETYSRVFAPPTSVEDMELEKTINDFVDDYRMLPLVVRAKLENWDIDQSELLFESESFQNSETLGAHRSALYRGTNVVVTSYSKGYDTRQFHCLHTEISALAQSRHPNIVGFIGASFDSQTCLVVTEHMSNGALDAHFHARRQRTPHWRPCKPQALDWALGLLRAVNYLHQSEPAIVHRDLRPQHLHLPATGVLKLAGFGRCRILSAATRAAVRESAIAAPARAAAFGADLNLDDSDSDSPGPSLDRDSHGETRPGPPGPSTSACISGRMLACAPRARAGGVYTALELQLDPEAHDPAVDIYSVAMCMWFIRVGHDPVFPATADDGAPAGGPTEATSRPRSAREGAAMVAAAAAAAPAALAAAAAAAAARPDTAELRWPGYAAEIEAAWAEAPRRRPTADDLTTRLELLTRSRGGLRRPARADSWCAPS